MKQKIYDNINNREPEKWVRLDCDNKIKSMYYISNYGRIKNLKGKILQPDIDIHYEQFRGLIKHIRNRNSWDFVTSYFNY